MKNKKIKILSDDLINQIAAGEVIERPGSIVKELVENSLDASANKIFISIEDGGKKSIQINDNGCGMSPDDLKIAVMRHATSKINKQSDLFNISTLGFRGEALPSIASISNINIQTKSKSNDAFEITMQGGKLISEKLISHNIGTTITIRSLFDNIPARKKFLKSSASEKINITKILKTYFLSFPDIYFIYKSNGKIVYELPVASLEERIVDVLGSRYKDNLLDVNLEKGKYSISGYIGNFNTVQKRSGNQFIYVNGRHIKCKKISNTIFRAFKSLLQRGEYPFYLLNINVDKEEVDVNVHPTKQEIHFKNEWHINQVIRESLVAPLKNIIDAIPDTYGFIYSEQTENTIPLSFETNSLADKSVDFINSETESNLLQKKVEDILSDKDDELEISRIWQIHNKYIITEIMEGIIIVDQHVAHERILYEQALKAFESKEDPSQGSLFPKTFSLKGEEYDYFLNTLPYLNKIGFKIREFGENTLIIEGAPVDIRKNSEMDIINNVIDNFAESRSLESDYKEYVASNYSCKAAIKAGDKLEEIEMKHLLNKLFICENPYYCPHGRPIIVNLTVEELDKRFERL